MHSRGGGETSNLASGEHIADGKHDGGSCHTSEGMGERFSEPEPSPRFKEVVDNQIKIVIYVVGRWVTRDDTDEVDILGQVPEVGWEIEKNEVNSGGLTALLKVRWQI